MVEVEWESWPTHHYSRFWHYLNFEKQSWKIVKLSTPRVMTVQILLTSAGWLIFNQAVYPRSSTSYPLLIPLPIESLFFSREEWITRIHCDITCMPFFYHCQLQLGISKQLLRCYLSIIYNVFHWGSVGKYHTLDFWNPDITFNAVSECGQQVKPTCHLWWLGQD